MMLRALNGAVAAKMSHVGWDVVIVIQMTNVMVTLFVAATIANRNFQLLEPSGTLKQIAALVCINKKN